MQDNGPNFWMLVIEKNGIQWKKKPRKFENLKSKIKINDPTH